MSFSSAWLFFCRRSISSEMSTAESSCTKRSSSIFVSSSAMGCSKSRKVIFAMVRSVLHGHRIEAAPQIPGGHAAPWRPPRCQRLDPGAPLAPGGRLAVQVVQADRPQQTQVVQREHIRAEQVEDQEHLRGPAADAANV